MELKNEQEKNFKTKVCRNCSAEFSCGHLGGCWCSELPNIMPLEEGKDCLCPDCLKEVIDAKVKEYEAKS